MTEIWKPIAWAPGYEVSDMGRVRSLDRKVFRPAGKVRACVTVRKGKVLKQDVFNSRAVVNVAGRKCSVHRLVAEAFIGPCPDGHYVCHGPGGRLDNRLENISYGTPSKNHGEDKLRDGTLLRGFRNPQSKLTEAQVADAKRRIAAGESKASIARELGVTKTNVGHIALGRSWSWLEVA
jgi:phosphatidylserine decarboxylase